MIEVSRPTCSFQNERVSFESYIDEFTRELYEEFDLKTVIRIVFYLLAESIHINKRRE